MSEQLLAIDNLRIEAGERVLLEGLSFAVAAGERLAIVGESGSGKTLATRAIPGLLAPGLERVAGTIRFEGRELTALGERVEGLAGERDLHGREVEAPELARPALREVAERVPAPAAELQRAQV